MILHEQLTIRIGKSDLLTIALQHSDVRVCELTGSDCLASHKMRPTDSKRCGLSEIFGTVAVCCSHADVQYQTLDDQ